MSDLFQETVIHGCYIYRSSLFRDQRGSFTKVFSSDIFNSIGLSMPVAEVFFSESHKGVIRGMHFQLPPHDHAKVVSCVSGKILDVVLDLRKSSKSYGKTFSTELTGENESTLLIPKGCAHGFYSYENKSVVSYVVETGHHKEFDSGIRWNSFGFRWPTDNPTISARDSQLMSFEDFNSPF